jgi:hypothetical protein
MSRAAAFASKLVPTKDWRQSPHPVQPTEHLKVCCELRKNPQNQLKFSWRTEEKLRLEQKLKISS